LRDIERHRDGGVVAAHADQIDHTSLAEQRKRAVERRVGRRSGCGEAGCRTRKPPLRRSSWRMAACRAQARRRPSRPGPPSWRADSVHTIRIARVHSRAVIKIANSLR
jgi:hypothetical protein